VTRLRRLVALFAAVLIVAMWRLWTPQVEFPQVPFLEGLCRVPVWCDWLALSGIAIGLLLSMVGGDARKLPRAGLALFTACLAASILLDQHRLQPWAYQFLIAGAVLSLTPTAYGLRLLRLLVVSIYIWSAVSKIDAAFLESHGQLLLHGLLRSTGIDAELWSDTARRSAAATFPVGELCVALLLAVRRTRPWGLAASIVMHALLLWTLGPWGLGHKPGVLIWNVCFIVQNVLLFRRTSSPEPPTLAGGGATYRAAAASILVALAAVMPLLESTGWWDHWPSWAVYSSRPETLTMLVREARLDDLPPTLRTCVGAPEPLTDWHPVSIDAWSFDLLQCPVYPQERYRLAVIGAIAEEAGLGDDLRVRVESSPERRTGERTKFELPGLAEIRARCDAFWFNTRPRRADRNR
jgi:hypothetical protein